MRYLFFAIIALLTLQSCNDIFATNIEGKLPVLILPQSEDTVSNNPVHFKWEAMEGATKYRLQIATPSFANISDYVLDSIIEGTDFYLSLDTLQYELKLTAMNAGYESNTLGPIKFWVGTTSSDPVEENTVVLTSPTDNSYKNATFDRSFSWNSITDGIGYSFVLVKGTSFSGGQQVYSTPLPATNIQQVIVNQSDFPLEEGQYFWGVKAWTASGELPYVTRTFFIDTVRPSVPTLVSPTNGQTISLASNSSTITFTWSYDPTSDIVSSPVSSIIELSLSPTFSTIVDSQTVTALSASFTLTENTYYWRVKNIDAAGNSSIQPSNNNSLIVTP